MLRLISIVVILVSVAAKLKIQSPDISLAPKTPPSYTEPYIVSGYIDLPYAEIHEQFTLFYDPKNNRSRVDYYNGMVKTMQFGGTVPRMVKLAFMTTETVYNQLNCFEVKGSYEIPIFVQKGMPDLSKFKYLGKTDFKGRTADEWQYVEDHGPKTATYTFLSDAQTGQPLHYTMFGYDSLFGSHFDKYYIEYSYYSQTQPSADLFEVPSNMTCHGFPGPGQQKGSAVLNIEMNPMSEFIDGNTKHHDEMFDGFKQTHGKDYSSVKENEARKSVFVQNVRFIQSTNRAGKSYRVDVNHLADRSRDELKLLRGFRRTKTGPNAVKFDPKLHNLRGLKAIPDSIDWRLYGAVSPVKDQALCGSCWSFGTAGTLEGTLFLKTNMLERLSQQELMDCSWGEGNNACDGGEDWRAYEWVMKHGLSSEYYYGPYLSQDGMCHSRNVSAVANITGYVNVTDNDESALRAAIAMNGPISVAIDASHSSFSFYANGVYYEPKCGNGPDDLDHAVLAVGYGKLNGQGYWLVKNSWSTYWGNDGYVLMSPKDNNCGVMTTPTFATM